MKLSKLIRKPTSIAAFPITVYLDQYKKCDLRTIHDLETANLWDEENYVKMILKRFPSNPGFFNLRSMNPRAVRSMSAGGPCQMLDMKTIYTARDLSKNVGNTYSNYEIKS